MSKPNIITPTARPAAPRRRRPAHGFTLVEVLVAVVVFSIGLLGIATLQMTGMKQTYNSQLRATATAMTLEMADRMRANPTGVDNGDYNIGGTGAPSATMPTAYSEDCGVNTCTAAEMAVYDLVQWADPGNTIAGSGLDDVLPSGAGIVCLDDSPDDGDSTDWQCSDSGDTYAIKIEWVERGLDEDEADTITKNMVMRVVP